MTTSDNNDDDEENQRGFSSLLELPCAGASCTHRIHLLPAGGPDRIVRSGGQPVPLYLPGTIAGLVAP